MKDIHVIGQCNTWPRKRYALENDKRVDVLVARSVQTDRRNSTWSWRRPIGLLDDVDVLLPILDDLILTIQIH